MGSCLSVSISCDQVVNQISQCLSVNGSYIYNLSENLAALHKEMEVLKAKRDDVQARISREEFTGRRQMLAQVQVWLKNVLDIENQFNDLLRTSTIELQRLCCCGLCSKNVKMSYCYGKRVNRLLKVAKRTSSQGELDVVTEEVHVTEVEEIPIQPTIVGHETLLERVWNRLMDDGVGVLGLYGMGGVGKTTLLARINNKFTKTRGSFVVIWVVVSKNLDILRIQEDIAKKLGFWNEEWDKKNENRRALDIHNVLKRRKFVLFLDDIWAKVNLPTIGVILNGCKVAFTTRSRDVCGRMEVDELMEVSCLGPDKAWELFQKKVGESTLKIHADIPDLARQVSGKCMKDEILPILKYSYDSLNGEVGFIDESQSRERAINQVYEILGTLVRACLLVEGEMNNISYVTMHDVVRDMALWIVQAGVDLRNMPDVKNWKAVRKMSLMRNDIERIYGSPECTQLTTLFLQKNQSLVHISHGFFIYVPMLVVLDLSGNVHLSELPLFQLVSLRYLDLSRTSLEQFHVGLQELGKLIHLNLESTRKLESISGILNLSSLRPLGLQGSSKTLDMSLLKELQLLEYLEKLTIEVSSGIVLEKLLSSHMLVKCIQKVGINNLGESTKVLTLQTTCDLRRLNLSGCRMGEIQIESKTLSPNNTGFTTPYFTNLSRIDISICYLLKDLTWLVFAPNLVDLRVTSSHQLEEIISKEKAASVPFQNLRSLYLSHSPMLKSICWSPLSFPCLSKISIEGCLMLRKIPLDSNSVVRFDVFSIEHREEEWIKEVEWEDEATQLRFLPFCKLDPGLTVKPNKSNTHTQSINSVEGSNQ
nr:disease resistance protein [Brassica rapa subsp. pekinensis]